MIPNELLILSYILLFILLFGVICFIIEKYQDKL
jgi:hypothetical protein